MKECDCGSDRPASARYGHPHLAWCQSLKRADIHVVPVNDLREHEDLTRICWCEPRVEVRDPETGDDYRGRCALVTHVSMDGRELIERYGLQ